MHKINSYGIKGPIKNNKDSNTDPWGTPAETSQTVDDVARLITFCFL
jgi:hypothetical protein